jgi:DNA polymerase III subunit delta'
MIVAPDIVRPHRYRRRSQVALVRYCLLPTGSMSWDVVGHERAVDLLRRTIAHGRLGHAYMLSGPRGVGKRALALALARAVNCETSGPGAQPALLSLGLDGAGDAGGDDGPPCGVCRRCRLIAEGKHPEVRVVGV